LNLKKMNCDLHNLTIIYRRLKRIFFDSYRNKSKLRKEILDIQESVRYLTTLKRSNQDNNWTEAIIRCSLKLQNKLLARYQKIYGGFPFEIVELAQ
jgi:hypothetical protein